MEPSIDCRILALAVIVAAFILAASVLSISVPNLRTIGCVWVGVSASKPTIFAYTKAVHEGGKGCHSYWFVLAGLPYEPFVIGNVLEGSQGFSIQTVDDLVLLGQESVPKLSGRFSGLLCDAI